MADASYPWEKMYNVMRALLTPSQPARKMAIGALQEFSIAFDEPNAVPEWATKDVHAVRRIAPFHDIKDAGSQGTIATWVNGASMEQLDTLYDALLHLFIRVVEMNERQLGPSRPKS